MRIPGWALAGASAAVLSGCAGAMAGGAGYSTPLLDANGRQVGSVEITPGTSATRLVVQSTGLPAGVHGMHVHETGRCDAPGFTTAGGHFNPTMRQHGMQNPQGPHLGDLPNLTVAANGTARAETTIAATVMGGTANLGKPGGTALVVHATADDMRTDPSGNSGARIACAVLSTGANQ